MTTISERIKTLILEQEINSKDLSIKSGVPQATISTLLNGKVKDIKADTLYKIATALDVGMHWLYTGKDEGKIYSDDEYISVDMYCVDEVTDDGTVLYGKEYYSQPLLVPEVLFRRVRAKADDCKAFRVFGDSMSPALNSEDVIIVNCSQFTSIIDGKYYALVYMNDHDRNNLQVKILRKRFDNSLIIHSVNADKYPDEEISPEQRSNVKIIGQVIARFSVL